MPLAVEFARGGLDVIGIDVDAKKVEQLNRGESHISDVPSASLRELLDKGVFRSTTDFSVIDSCDAVCVCVPTPLRKSQDPDISYIVAALDEIAAHLHPGLLVVLESTTYPGTTEELMLPRLAESGLVVGQDFFLAFSPERVDPGNREFTTRNTPKVIGGITPQCTQKAIDLYQHAVDIVVPVRNARVAEMVKLLENTFRAINIGMVNELAIMCDRLDIDVWEVIDAAKTKPFGFMPFYPGPGLGGHCIPIDPQYLSWKLRTINYTARFIELATNINSNMPQHVVGKIADALNDKRKSISGSKFLILGVAYKKDVGDTRESPALDVMGLLQKKGAELWYADPYVPYIDLFGDTMVSYDLNNGTSRFDCVVVITNHSSFDYQRILNESSLVFDTRNATAGYDVPASCTVVKL